MADHSHDHDSTGGRWVFWGFIVIAVYFVFTEHRAHAIQYLPFLLVLACPLMHLFHGHAGHGRNRTGDNDDDTGAVKTADDNAAGKENAPPKKRGRCH